ncbi:Methyl-CpG-binding domain-containing protein 2 [Abeliophyllum distichum]|uniref:Methyl-CpG-binding domain-containing protein 2 n=1 Tax=Abeliophyllum distichum TaxID=126358 RepID=A0ABD1TIB1_9LAMI
MVSDSVRAYTVQCANCSKWRFIPTKKKYEQIRETIAELPFLCETAREWRPEITCSDESDLVKDGSWRWAIDKPCIPQPPPGWQRILRIRAKGGTKFADVYYIAPSGKRFRSISEVQSFLNEHPEYLGVTLSQFSFQTPAPMEENYVRKRRASSAASHESGTLMPVAAIPISWIAPDQLRDLHFCEEGNSTSPAES